MPFSKLMGPLMHLPFFLLVPYSLYWLSTTPSPESGVDKFHHGWVVYTTIITVLGSMMCVCVCLCVCVCVCVCVCHEPYMYI